MATSVGRMKGLRERERRGLRSFTVPVSEDDLRVMAKHGYEGALSTDHEQQAQAVSRFITDALAARRPGNGVASRKTGFRRNRLILRLISHRAVARRECCARPWSTARAACPCTPRVLPKFVDPAKRRIWPVRATSLHRVAGAAVLAV
jgi:hypothetical protein